MTARVVTIVLGAWLFASAFLWRHGPAQETNTWICGLLTMGFAFAALRFEEARFLGTTVAVWLFISAFALATRSSGTIWNNAVVAVALFIASLVPNETTGERRFGYRRTQLPA